MLLLFRRFKRLLHLKFHHGVFGQSLKTLLANQPFFPCILTKEIIKDKTYNRQKNQD